MREKSKPPSFIRSNSLWLLLSVALTVIVMGWPAD
jgi:hypothetical protein